MLDTPKRFAECDPKERDTVIQAFNGTLPDYAIVGKVNDLFVAFGLPPAVAAKIAAREKR